jgi:N-methylhydantoinase A
MLMTDPMQDFIQTSLMAATQDNGERVAAVFAGMEEEARAFFTAADFAPDALTIERYGDMRYLGQEHTVRVAFPPNPIAMAAVNEGFHTLHERAYTFRLDSPTEIVNFHVVARAAAPKPAMASPSGGSGAAKGRRLVDFDEAGRLETTIYERADLIPGAPLKGPAVIEEPASVTVAHPGQRVTLDAIGNLRIETGLA